MSIAPNPLVSRLAVLRCSPPTRGAAQLDIFDAAGKRALGRTLEPGEDQSLVLDLGRLGPGVYVARLSSESHATTQQLVVAR